jgi:hypothetical protein
MTYNLEQMEYLQEQIREDHTFVGILITVCRVSDNTPKLLSVDDTTIINKEPKVFISLVSTSKYQ